MSAASTDEEDDPVTRTGHAAMTEMQVLLLPLRPRPDTDCETLMSSPEHSPSSDTSASAASASRRGGTALVLAALLLALGGGGGLFAVSQALASRGGDGVTVTGSARIDVRADRAVWTINAYEQAPDVATAVARTEAAVEAVTAYLLAGGIAADQIQLDGLSTNINYNWTDNGMTSEIVSYSAYRNLRVRSDDVELIDRLSREFGSLLSSGIGVNAYSPEYYVTSLPELRPQLLEAAVADALVRAEAMVSVVEGSIGGVRAIRSGPFQVSTPDSVDVSDYGMYDTSTIDKTVTATVSVTFTTD